MVLYPRQHAQGPTRQSLKVLSVTRSGSLGGAGNRALESEPAPWRQRLPSGGGSAAIIDVSDAVE